VVLDLWPSQRDTPGIGTPSARAVLEQGAPGSAAQHVVVAELELLGISIGHRLGQREDLSRGEQPDHGGDLSGAAHGAGEDDVVRLDLLSGFSPCALNWHLCLTPALVGLVYALGPRSGGAGD
jgi:hypothetical protein